ncbi:hypothetical protein CA12_24930 [Alienimonas californiensis]|uniref:Uncharacterized protein n=1 Tax=Alienimonas californiensis TaxID=2527989 RepID=A0A517PAK6_9PLAN|nr:hypothetical protein CA12_24930 [Alienimonas californiensis]
MVGGDINVGETDAGKSGLDLPDARTDGYNDTYALLTRGLVDGLRLGSLTHEIGSTDDDTPGDGVFPCPGAGAIDAPYVGGADRSDGLNATRSGSSCNAACGR